MSNLLVIASIKKAYDGNKRYTGKKINKDTRNNNIEYNHEVDYSFEEHLNLLVSSNEDLKKFFKLLADQGQEVDKKDRNQVNKEFHELCEAYMAKKQECEQLLSEVESASVSVTTDIRSSEHFEAVRTTEGYGFENGKYGYNSSTFCVGFNGIKITRDMLNDSKNPYEQEFLNWEKDNTNIDNEIESLKEQINKKKSSLRINPFKRDEKKQEISTMEDKLSELEGKSDDGIKKKDRMETFENLTNVQKQKIAQYLDCVDECQKIGDNIGEKVDEAILISKGKNDDKRKKWTRAFENMIALGQISQEEMEKVKNTLLEEIQKKEKRYPEGKPSYEMNSISYLTAEAIKWYAEQVNMEMKHEENLTPLQKREKVLSELENEEKTISKAEKIIEQQSEKEGNEVGED